MAQKTTIQLVDDLDGTVSNDIATVEFGLDGVTYEIDLTEGNADALRKGLADFVASARRTGGRVKRGLAAVAPTERPGRSKEQTQAIRDWAKTNGFQIAERGRVPGSVIEAFETAHAAPVKASAPSRRRKVR
ncbi:MAG TPA: Lsr2 family protein [Pseudonocardiaceae bacterium]|jgi:hypothetical protein|nr:Lsr2 family protein [Pseudonocardiaceae bacterium]